jgi:electron transfer flavoprotein alpha subunit
MGSGILIFAEHEGGQIKKTAYELLGKARELAAGIGGSVSAVVVGTTEIGELGAYGAETVYTVSGAHFDNYTTGAFTKAVAAVVAQADPAIVLGAASPVGKDLFPRLSARLGAGLAPEVTALSAAGGTVSGKRPILAGKAMVDVTVKSPLALYTVRPNSFGAADTTGGSANVVAVDAGVSAGDIKARVVEVKASASTVADLTEADRIVAGGRSLKSKENFDSVIRPLAAAANATPGASRAAVDAGYAGHGDQVGQTGKVVNPSLYFALGISGAIQHLAGMRTSKVIVAINTDPEAPIFQHATYGIVEDLFTVAPLLQAELARALEG